MAMKRDSVIVLGNGDYFNGNTWVVSLAEAKFYTQADARHIAARLQDGDSWEANCGVEQPYGIGQERAGADAVTGGSR